MKKYAALLLVILGFLQYCDAFKILAVFPMPSPSHSILGDAYVRLLLEAGHEVTYTTPFPNKLKPNPKLHVVDVSELLQLAPSNIVNIQKIVDNEISVADRTLFMSMLMKISTLLMNNKNIIALINDPNQHFDLVINQYLFTDVYAGFAALYQCPFIWAIPLSPESMVLRLIHEQNNPAVLPDVLSAAIPPLSFVQRVKGLFSMAFMNGIEYFYMAPSQKVLYEETFGPLFAKRGRSLPPYEEVIYNGSFVLSNYHESLGHPVSLPPNCKVIAGYHIDVNTKPMDKDLQQIMDNAKHGVIYFSMGSNLKSKDLPEVLKQDILKVLGGLKETVLWKFEEELPNLPKNVHIIKWAPQQNILAHNNTRLFITHGGFGSVIETVHFGVPVITIPVFADQFLNAEKAVLKGYGRKVDLGYGMAGELKLALEDILSNPKYAQKVREVSMIYHDRIMPPAKELVHWVEHVIKTRGAPHLRSPALMLSWYQKMYLDLVALVLVVLLGLKHIIKKLYKFIKGSTKQKTN